ncbi:MAG TPA: cytochrome c [Candidatus Baltobacteraceae bacterium]|nr:cytochrome c [Candidatus Baltobacteraceae bacterium]
MIGRTVVLIGLVLLVSSCSGGKQGQSSTTTSTTTTTQSTPAASPVAASPAASASMVTSLTPAPAPTAAPPTPTHSPTATRRPLPTATKRPATPLPPKKAAAATISFTGAQAVSGEKQWEQSCAPCHGANMEGGAGPALAGPNSLTLTTKLHATVSDIFGYMTTNMPLNAPASLTHDQYVNIMAYVMKLNGYAPSSVPLTFERADSSKAPLRAPGHS